MIAAAVPTRSFHAGELVSLNWTEEGLVLGVLRPDSVRFDLSLNVLRALSIDGFRQSNSISDLCVVSGREPTGEDLSGGSLTDVLAVLYPEPARTAKAEAHEDHASFLKGVVQNLNSGEGALVILGCGPCGELIAHCATVELHGPL
jgi:hypothetical protein